MCDLADSLIGKANQIEASCHISFFSEFKKQKSQHSLAIRIARAAGSKLFFSYHLRRTSCVPLVRPHITRKPSRWWREVTSAPISPVAELSSRFDVSSRLSKTCFSAISRRLETKEKSVQSQD